MKQIAFQVILGNHFGMGNSAVVIPVHNRPVSLLRALESIRAQSRAVAECVVVDDGSTESLENSRRFLEKEISGGKWLRFSENLGVSAARNAGVVLTSAKWICFLDSDDCWMPEKLERQLAWHAENPAVRISQVEEAWIRNGQRVNKPDEWKPGEGDIFSKAVERCAISPSAIMMRRDLWEEQGGFDEEFRVCEDYELWLRITDGEPVGLVEGGNALVEKHGGRSDQLSAYPAMDRHRVAILLRFLGSTDLPSDKRELVCRAIREKAKIVAMGAAKRGNVGREKLFAELLGIPDEVDSLYLLDMFQRIRTEIASSEFTSVS